VTSAKRHHCRFVVSTTLRLFWWFIDSSCAVVSRLCGTACCDECTNVVYEAPANDEFPWKSARRYATLLCPTMRCVSAQHARCGNRVYIDTVAKLVPWVLRWRCLLSSSLLSSLLLWRFQPWCETDGGFGRTSAIV